MIYSNCQYPLPCDCSDCEELMYGLIREIDHPKYEGYDDRFEMEYDPNTGESYKVKIREDKMGRSVPMRPPESFRIEKTQSEKLSEISKSSPKMYYTPDEIRTEDAVIKINFWNNNIVPLQLAEDDKSIASTTRVFFLLYTKMHLRNCKYEYIMVQEGQEDLVRELYFGEKANKKERTYI